jgi:hypothetical protein
MWLGVPWLITMETPPDSNDNHFTLAFKMNIAFSKLAFVMCSKTSLFMNCVSSFQMCAYNNKPQWLLATTPIGQCLLTRYIVAHFLAMNEGIYFAYHHSNLVGCVFGCKYNMYHGSQPLFMMK